MEKLSMCRLCLAKNVLMYGVVNKHLHKLYEKLTDIPFVTEDKRPILACFLCCAKLKQGFQFMTKCLKAEELFAQMNERNPLINTEHFEFCSGFTRSPIEQIDIVENFQTESIVLKEELPAVCEEDDIDVTAEYLEDVKDIPLQHSESDSEGDVPLKMFKIEVEEEIEESKKKRRTMKTNRAPVTKKLKLDTRRTNQEDTIVVAGLKKNKQSSLEGIRTTKNRTSKHGPSVKESYKSDQCGSKRVKKFEQYTRTRICEKLFNCDVCQRSFSRKPDLKEHFRIHTGEKPYQCDVCQRSFRQSFSLTRHNRTHTGEKPYQCDVCQRSFSLKCNLTTHVRVHGEKPYQCDVCQRNFSHSFSLIKHIRTHARKKPYQCDVCQRSFSKKSILCRHNRTHTGEKPYQCDVCQRSFSMKCNLKAHVRLHTGQKPYQCDVCRRSYRVRRDLINHIRVHTGKKPYQCEVCQRSFSKKCTLTKHSNTHW